MTEKNRKLLKAASSRPGVMIQKGTESKRRELPAISTNFVGLEHSYLRTCKALRLIVKHLTTYKYTVKDSFHFTEEIVDQLDFFMGSLDVDSAFRNISLCTNELFKESETVGGLSKSEFKELLSLATKDSHFIFYEIHFMHFYSAFLIYHEKKKKKRLERCLLQYRPFILLSTFYYRK